MERAPRCGTPPCTQQHRRELIEVQVGRRVIGRARCRRGAACALLSCSCVDESSQSQEGTFPRLCQPLLVRIGSTMISELVSGRVHDGAAGISGARLRGSLLSRLGRRLYGSKRSARLAGNLLVHVCNELAAHLHLHGRVADGRLRVLDPLFLQNICER